MSPLRQTRSDFATPTHQVGGALSLDRRPDALAWDQLTAYAPGPAAVGDPAAGLANRVWRARAAGGEIHLARANDDNTAWEAWQPLFAFGGPGAHEIDLAFEQNARPVVCAERPTGSGGAPEVWLYRFDPRAGGFTFTAICAGRTPRVVLDDPRATEESDILLFYVSDANDRIEMRQQRELYETVHPTPVAGAAGLHCEDAALATDSRLHLYYSRRDAATGRYSLAVLESVPYPVRMEMEAVTAGLGPWSAAVKEVVLPADMATEAVRPGHAIATATLVTLLIQVTPDAGAAGALRVEDAVKPGGGLRSAALQEVAVTHTPAVEDAVRPASRAVSAQLVTYVLVLPELVPEAVRPAHRLVSATLENA